MSILASFLHLEEQQDPSMDKHSIASFHPFMQFLLSNLLILHGRKTLNQILSILSMCIYCIQLSFILLTFWNIPSFFSRVFRYYLATRKTCQNARAEFLSQTQLSDLPIEIIQALILRMDPISICRLSSTNSYWYEAAMDNYIWETKFNRDWSILPKKRKRLKLDYFSLYKIRYLASKNQNESQKDQDIRKGFWSGIVRDEFYHSLSSTFHLMMVPFKILGFLSWPCYRFCYSTLRYPSSPSLACLRFFVIDLTLLAKKCFTFKDSHVFFIINIMCMFLLILDEIALCLSYINWASLFIVTFGGIGGLYSIDSTSNWFRSFLNVWSLITFPFLVTVQIQLILIPWSFLTGDSLFTLLLPKSFFNFLYDFSSFSFMTCSSCQGLVQSLMTSYPTTTLLIGELIWIPIMCSVEESTYYFSSPLLRNGSFASPFAFIGFFIRSLTFVTQCLFGAFAYFMFLTFAVLQEIGFRSL